MNKFNFILIFISTFISQQNYLTEFEKTEQVSTTTIIKDIPAMTLGFLHLTDSLMITQDVRAKEDYMKMYNYKKNNSFIQFGKTGRGPTELSTPLLNGLSTDKEQYYLFDPNMKKIHICDLNSFDCKPSEIINFKETDLQFIFDGKLINSDLVAVTGMIKDGVFATINLKNNNEVNFYGEFPLNPSGIDPYILSDINTGGIRISPCKKYLIYSTTKFGYICCYKINNNQLEKIWEHWITEPQYSVSNGKIYLKSDNILGFMDVAIDDDNVYAIYHGKKMNALRSQNAEESPETIMKFSLKNGEPMAKYTTDVPITRIAINPDGEIYCIAKPMEYNLVKVNID